MIKCICYTLISVGIETRREVNGLANIKSAQKRIDIIKKKTLLNKSKKSEIKTYIKKFEAAIDAEDMDTAQAMFNVLEKKLGRAANKNILHKNATARKVSSMQKKLNGLQA